MLPIILCDDDHFTLQLLSELLERAIRQSKAEAKLVCLASTGQELLQFIRGGGSYLYFLDYDLGRDSLNGVDLVRQIYHTDPGGKIVFVTSHGEKGMDILRSGVRPFGFIENVWIRMRWFGSGVYSIFENGGAGAAKQRGRGHRRTAHRDR